MSESTKRVYYAYFSGVNEKLIQGYCGDHEIWIKTEELDPITLLCRNFRGSR